MPTKRQVRKKLADMGVDPKYLQGQDGALSPLKGTLKGAAYSENNDGTNLRMSEVVDPESVKGGDPNEDTNPVRNENHIMVLLSSTRSPYPPERILEVMTRYVTLGTYEKAVEGTGISAETVKSWKRQDWWPEVYAFASRMLDTRIEGQMTSIMETAIEQVKDRLLNGDYLVHQGRLTGERKPLDISDLTRTFGVMFDKRQLSRGLGAIAGGTGSSPMDKLEVIAKRLESAIEKRFGVTLDGVAEKD